MNVVILTLINKRITNMLKEVSYPKIRNYHPIHD